MLIEYRRCILVRNRHPMWRAVDTLKQVIVEIHLPSEISICRKEPCMASKILSGRYKVSHDGVLALAQRSAEELHDMNKRLEHTQQPYARYQTTRQEIQSMPAHRKRDPGKKPSVKDMPAYDPDAEVVGLTLTIPSWSSSIDRIAHSNLDIVSDAARLQLHRALLELQEIINTMISAITEEQ